MIAASRSFEAPKEAQVQSWLISFLLHGAVVLVALLLIKQANLPLPTEPFRWNISLVSSIESDSTMAVLPEKAPPNESPIDPPPVVAAPPPTAFSPSERPDTPAPEPGTRKSGAKMHRDTKSMSASADKLYQVVGPDGSVSFTNVPSDSRFQEKVIDSSRLSTVASAAALTSTPKTGISPRPSPATIKNNNHWLWEALLRRMVEETNGEVCFRAEPVEGRVMMQLVIDDVGKISQVQVLQSSGHAILDQTTVDILRQISYVSLSHPLEKPSVTLQFPMTYRLRPRSQGPTWCARING